MSIPDSGDFDHARAPYPAPQAPPPAGPNRLFRWYDVLLIGLIVLLSQFIPGLIAAAVGYATGELTLEGASAEGLPPTVIMIAIAGSGIVMGLGALVLRNMREIDWATLGLRPTTLRALAAAVLAFVAYMAVAETIGRVIQIDPDGELARELLGQLIPPGATLIYLVLAFAFIGAIVPAAEELLFRGLLIAWLRERSNGTVAVIVSALIFSIVHGYFMTAEVGFGLFATAQVFVLGLLLGWLAIWSRSLWPPILLHIINNVVSLVVSVAG